MFLNASSRMALLPLSAAYHVSIRRYSKPPQFCCRSSSLSCCVIIDELKFDTDSPRGSFAYTRLIRVPDWNASVASVQLCKDLVHQLHLRFIHYVQVKQNPKGQSKLANGVASQAVVKMEGEGEHWDWGLRFNSL